ncbi:MAG: peroxiredoxin [Pseudomonadota bacterium]
MTIAVGDSLPATTFFEMTADGPKGVPSAEVLGQGTVAVFGVPGAFTPTCHMKHMPSFVAGADALRAKGVDSIVCVTVNDPFVAKAWADAAGAPGAGIRVVGDPAAEFAQASGISFDGSAVGLGIRAQRFSMLVKDGKVAALNTEEKPSDMDVSSAEKLLEAL